MLKKIVLVFILLFIMGCVSCPPCPPQINLQRPISKTICLPRFNSLVVNGDVTVEIDKGPQKLIVCGTLEDLEKFRVTIINCKLNICGKTTCTHPIYVKLCTPSLKNITVSGNASITKLNFYSECLSITARGNGSINLRGRFDAANIHQRGTGKIEMSWIDSDKLVVDSSNSGPIYLKGNVNCMLVKLIRDGNLDAKCLRAHKAVVLTTDDAVAHVFATKSLSAYASGNSNIYYYKRPPKLTVVTKDSGNVLKPNCIY